MKNIIDSVYKKTERFAEVTKRAKKLRAVYVHHINSTSVQPKPQQK